MRRIRPNPHGSALRLLPAALVLLLVVATAAHAKSYTVDRIESDVVADRDGALHVTEFITFTFDGRFRYAFRDLPIAAGEQLSDVRVAEGATSYAEAAGKRPETFRVERENGSARITWRFRARNESRTFTVAYTLSGAVRRHDDVAEVYVQFVGDQWDRRIGVATARLRIPDGVRTDTVRAWAHGPLHGTVEFLRDGAIGFDVSPLPARTYWEGRVVTSAARFDGVPSTGERRLGAILAEEEAWADEANRRREAARARAEALAREDAARRARIPASTAIAFALAALAAGVWTSLYLRIGKPHDVSALAPVGEVPSRHAPALVAYLLHRAVPARAMVATLLDLARRGHLRIRERIEEKTSLFGTARQKSDFGFERTGKDAADLAPFETGVLEFLSGQAGDAAGFTLENVKRVARSRPHRFRRGFAAWGRQVKEAGARAGFFEPYAGAEMTWNAIMGACVLIGGIVLCALTRSPAGAPALIAGFLQAVLSAALQRRTPEGQRLLLEWNGFKRHLDGIARALGPVSLDSGAWGRYLAAAVIFGMHRQLLPRLRVADGHAGGTGYVPAWYVASAHGAGDEGISGLAGGFTAMVDAVSGAMSSASGAGGGASAGGGGGSGGGGGGAG